MINWRGVVGYEDYYKVSDTGEIWSVRSQRKLATPVNKKRGYMEWTPKIAGKSRTMSVHITVAQAFLGPSNGRQVRHLNGNKLDNRLANLAYGTPLENQADRKSEDYQGPRLLSIDQESEIRKLSSQGVRTTVLADQFGVSRSVIERILDKNQIQVSRELLWRCVETGAGILVIAETLGVTHGAVSTLLKRMGKPMRVIRKEIPLNRSISVNRLRQLIET